MLDLMERALEMDPRHRFSSQQCLQHPTFQVFIWRSFFFFSYNSSHRLKDATIKTSSCFWETQNAIQPSQVGHVILFKLIVALWRHSGAKKKQSKVFVRPVTCEIPSSSLLQLASGDDDVIECHEDQENSVPSYNLQSAFSTTLLIPTINVAGGMGSNLTTPPKFFQIFFIFSCCQFNTSKKEKSKRKVSCYD